MRSKEELPTVKCSVHGVTENVQPFRRSKSPHIVSYRCIDCMKSRSNRHYLANKQDILERHKEYYEEKKDYILTRNAKYKSDYYKSAPGKESLKRNRRLTEKKQSAQLKDPYLRKLIADTSSILTKKDVPKELLVIKRQQMILYRLIKEAKHGE